MIRKLCDYQNRLASDEYIAIIYTYGNTSARCRITKEDVIVPCDQFIEINHGQSPCLLNKDWIVQINIERDVRLRL